MVANWLRHSSEAVPRVPFEISPLFSSPFRRSTVPCAHACIDMTWGEELGRERK